MVNKVIQKRESFSSVGCCCWRFYGVHQRYTRHDSQRQSPFYSQWIPIISL